MRDGVKIVALIALLVTSIWLFMNYLHLTLLFLVFGGKAGVLDGGVAFQCGVFGYLSFTLLRRLVQGRFAWPTPRLFVANALTGYAAGWGVGVAILTARQIAQAVQGTLTPPVSNAIDVLFFALVTMLISFPAVIAFSVGTLMKRGGSPPSSSAP